MSILKTKGIVLRDYELFDQDKIIVFHTRDLGMLKVVAKGARKIKSRFAAAVQFPCYIDMVVYKKQLSEMGLLTDCGVQHFFPRIKNDKQEGKCE